MKQYGLLLLVGLDYFWITSPSPVSGLSVLLLLTLPVFLFTRHFFEAAAPFISILILAFFLQSFWENTYFISRAALTLLFCIEFPYNILSTRTIFTAGLVGTLAGYALSLLNHDLLEMIDGPTPLVGAAYLVLQSLIVAGGLLLLGWLLMNRPLPGWVLALRRVAGFDYLAWLIFIGGLWLLLLRPVLMQKNTLDTWFVGFTWAGMAFALIGLDREQPLKITRRWVMVFLVATMLALSLAMVFFMWFSTDETTPYYKGVQILQGRADFYAQYSYRMPYMPGTYYFPALGDWLTGWVIVGPRIISMVFTFTTWGLLAFLAYRKAGYTGALLLLAILVASPFLNHRMVLLKGYYPYALTLVLSLVVVESRLNHAVQAVLLTCLMLLGVFIRHSVLAVLGAVPLYILIFMGPRPLALSIMTGMVVGALLLLPFSPGIFEQPLAFFTNHFENLTRFLTGTTAQASGSSSSFVFNRDIIELDVVSFFVQNPVQTVLLILLVATAIRGSVGNPVSDPSMKFATLVFAFLMLSHIVLIWFMGTWLGASVTSYHVYFAVLPAYLTAVLGGRILARQHPARLAAVFILPVMVVFATTHNDYTNSLYGFVASANDSQIDRTQRGAACLANYITSDDLIFYGNWDAGPLLYHPEWRVLPAPLDLYFNKLDSEAMAVVLENSNREDFRDMDDPAKLGYWTTELGIDWLLNQATVVITLDASSSYPFDERHGQAWLDIQRDILDNYYEQIAICQEREPLAVYRRKQDDQ